MSIKDIIDSELYDLRINMSQIFNSIDYIEEYGHVGLYDEKISEEDLKKIIKICVNKSKEIMDEMDRLTEIIRDQFEY